MTASLVMGSFAPVFADGEQESGGFKSITKTVCSTSSGSYGSTTECHDETEVIKPTPSKDITVVDTGIAEVATIATVLFLGGMAAFILAQKQLNV